MTNLPQPRSHEAAVLQDAFAGYEQQADRLSDARARVEPSSSLPGSAPASRRRALLVAASVAAVAAIALGVVLAEPGSGSDHDGTPAGGSPISPTAASSRSTPAPSHLRTTAASAVPPRTTTKATPAAHPLPSTRAEMVAAFKAVLAKTATFTVTESHGPYLIGVLTARGKRGGFDIQPADGTPGDTAMCEDAATSHCKITRVTGGGSLSTGHESTDGGGLLYLVSYVRPDGGTLLMHLSTLSDPKGGGRRLGVIPPLTIAQMAKILESDRW